MKIELVKYTGDSNEDITTHIEDENICSVRFTLKNKLSVEVSVVEDIKGHIEIRTTDGRLVFRPNCSNVIHVSPQKL